MHRVKLIKGRSYNGAIRATQEEPFVDVEDKAIADAAVATGYFEYVESEGDDNDAPADISKMTVPQLEAYAAEKGIDLAGASRKAEIIAKIAAAETADDNNDGENDGAADYGEDDNV